MNAITIMDCLQGECLQGECLQGEWLQAPNSIAGQSQSNDIRTFMYETSNPQAHSSDEDTPEVTMTYLDAEEFGLPEGCCWYGMSKRSVSIQTLKHGGVWHSECLEFLCTMGPLFMMRGLDDKHEIISLLLTMADNVMTADHASAAPAPSPAWDMLEMSIWYVSLSELMKEMKMVQEQYPSVVDNSPGVYVVSSAPYDAFLRALAAEVADRVLREE